jgi:transposase
MFPPMTARRDALPDDPWTAIADKACEAQQRVIQPSQAAGMSRVILSRNSVLQARDDDRHLYQRRPLIENFFTRLKPYRALVTRYDQHAINFLAAICLAASVLWLN